MEDKNKLVAAFIHLRQASILMCPFNVEVSKTLKELTEWIIETYSLTEDDIKHLDGIISELMNGW